MTDSIVKVTVNYERTKVGVHSKRNISKLKMTGIILSILLLSIAVFSSTEGWSMALAQQPVIPPVPQPNAPIVLRANASSPASTNFFAPNLGKFNVYGPMAPVAQPDFTCAGDPTKCGIKVTGTFNGTFEQADKDKISSVNATFTSPITVGTTLTKNTKYTIVSTDFLWNNSLSVLPTTQPDFAKVVSDVGLGGQQHGVSAIDRADVNQISESPGVLAYGHCDLREGNKIIAHLFCHNMVGHLINETDFYKYERDVAISPNLAIVIAASIPANTPLPVTSPGTWTSYGCSTTTTCTADQAQSFFPMNNIVLKDQSLKSPPPFIYPLTIPPPRTGTIPAPGFSSEQPVSLKDQPFFFAFLVYAGADIHEQELKTSGGK